jgi:hypothetical protein
VTDVPSAQPPGPGIGSRASAFGLLLAITALATGVAAAFLAWHHPLSPAMASGALALWLALTVWRPGWWLAVVPALLPLLNFAPWSGWQAFDEFDLLVLGTLAGVYLRWALDLRRADVSLPSLQPPAVLWLALLLGLLSMLGLYRGLADAGVDFAWFQGYSDPVNSLRLFKAPVYALLLWPLLRLQLRASPSRSAIRFCFGMLAGLGVVSLAALWERAAYPGLLDFSSLYRTTALFWEMHVGGAAIDAYLALAIPFVAWALWSARSPGQWAVAATLVLLAFHACLTTFSRGAYLAVAGSIVLLGLLLLGRRLGFRARIMFRRALVVATAVLATTVLLFAALVVFGYGGVAAVLLLMALCVVICKPRLDGWRGAGTVGLALALTLEVVVVFGTGNFMLSRLSASDRDFGSRLTHWQNGLGLLFTPGEWLWGIGLGRLPASYARFVPVREFSGAVQWLKLDDGRAAVQLFGPKSQEDLGGLFALTQRVPLLADVHYRVEFDARVFSRVDMALSVCESHLLYDRNCQIADIRLQPGNSSWQRVSLALHGPPLSAGNWFAPRLGVFALSVTNAGAQADIAQLRLVAPGFENLLQNGDFARQTAHWFPAAQFYFLPWHIDNLFLELLIERGIFGLVVVLGLVGLALWRVCAGPARHHPLAPFVAASLSGALLVGMVSSLMDVPRVAFLFFLVIFFALSLGEGDSMTRR